jgi:hypothetical protein
VQNEIIEGPPLLAGLAGLIDDSRAESHARLRHIIAARQVPQSSLEIFALTAREKAEAAQVHSQNRDVTTVQKAGATQQRPVAAERNERVEPEKVDRAERGIAERLTRLASGTLSPAFNFVNA